MDFSGVPALTLLAPRVPFANPRVEGEQRHGVVASMEALMRNDGPDDLATAMTQFLPQMGQDIISLATSLGLTPMVVLGARGANREAKEAFADYLDHLKELHGVQQQVLAQAAKVLEDQRGRIPAKAFDDKMANLAQLSANMDRLHRTIATYESRHAPPTLEEVAEDDPNLAALEQAVESAAKHTGQSAATQTFLALLRKGIQDVAQHPSGAAPSKAFIAWAQLLAGAEPDMAYLLDRLRRTEQARRNANVERCAAALAAAAMSGMATAMFPATGRAMAAVTASATAAGSTVNAGAAAAQTTLAQVAGGIFLPTQAMMIGAEALNIVGRRRDIAALQRDRGVIQETAVNRLDPELLKSIEEVIQREQSLGNSKVFASGAIIAGQSFMIAGTLCNLTGVGVVAVAPLSGLGAVMTIGGAIGKAATESRENRFKGEGATEAAKATQADRRSRQQQMILNGDPESAMKVAAGHYAQDQEDLANAKVLSLIHFALEEAQKRESKGGGHAYSPRQVTQHVEAMLEDGRKRKLYGSKLLPKGYRAGRTTLLESDVARMPEVFRKNYGPGFFDGNLAQARDRLKSVVHHHPSLETVAKDPVVVEEIARDVLGELVREPLKFDSAALRVFDPGAKKKVVTGQTLQHFLDANQRARAGADKVAVAALLDKGKKNLKSARHADVKNVAEAAYALKHRAPKVSEAPPPSEAGRPGRFDAAISAPQRVEQPRRELGTFHDGNGNYVSYL